MGLEQRRQAALKFLELFPQGLAGDAPLAHGFTAWTDISGDIPGQEYIARTKTLPLIFKEPLTFVIEATTAEHDRVAVQARSHGLLIDGNEYRNNYHFLFRFKDDQIQKVYEYVNVKTALEQLLPLVRAYQDKIGS